MIDPAQVTACLVTRGDVNLFPIIESLPFPNVIIYDNSAQPNVGVWGRYLAIAQAKTKVVYTQDDDCIVRCWEMLLGAYEPGVVTGNAEYVPSRLTKYHDTTLLGWGAIFDRILPDVAFEKWRRIYPLDTLFTTWDCEIVFPMLSRTKTIIGGFDRFIDGEMIESRPNRTWRQPGFQQRITETLAKVRAGRDRLAAMP